MKLLGKGTQRNNPSHSVQIAVLIKFFAKRHASDANKGIQLRITSPISRQPCWHIRFSHCSGDFLLTFTLHSINVEMFDFPKQSPDIDIISISHPTIWRSLEKQSSMVVIIELFMTSYSLFRFFMLLPSLCLPISFFYLRKWFLKSFGELFCIKDEMGLFAVFDLPLCVAAAMRVVLEQVEVLFEVLFKFKAGQLSWTRFVCEEFALSTNLPARVNEELFGLRRGLFYLHFDAERTWKNIVE